MTRADRGMTLMDEVTDHLPVGFPDPDDGAFSVTQSVLAALRAALAAQPGLAREIVPEGWVLVPREATVDMEVAGTEAWLVIAATEDRAAAIWTAMLAAAAPEEPSE